MREPARGSTGFWNSLRQGGVPSAIASIMGAPTAQHMAFIRSMMREQRRPEVLHTPLGELDAVVFDLETTGFSPSMEMKFCPLVQCVFEVALCWKRNSSIRWSSQKRQCRSILPNSPGLRNR